MATENCYTVLACARLILCIRQIALAEESEIEYTILRTCYGLYFL